MTRILVLLLTVCSLASAAPKARIKIDTERAAGQVDPHLFGNSPNIWDAASTADF